MCRIKGLRASARCISRSSDVLQLSHSGLRPHQLDKIATALTEAPWIKKLDLSGELIAFQVTDSFMAGLLLLLLAASLCTALSEHADTHM